MHFDIIVCDSGMSRRHMGKAKSVFGEDVLDENGHGSQIIEVINTIDSSLKIGVVKILDKNKEGSIDDLVEALRKCVNVEAKVILLAVALDQKIECRELEDVLTELSNKNKVILSSVFNGWEKSVPAIYKNVIGVKMNYKKETFFRYAENEAVQCELSTGQIICEATDGHYRPFSGNSLSASIMAAVCAKAIKDGEDLKRLLKSKKFEETYIRKYFDISNHCGAEKIQKRISFLVKELGFVEGNLYNQIETYQQLDSLFVGLRENEFLVNKNKFFKLEYLKDWNSFLNYFSCR